MKFLAIILIFASSNCAYADWFGPKDYDECILENMKGASNKDAVIAIKRACRSKFPDACRQNEKEFEAWKIKYRIYNANKPSCDADRSFKIKKCNQNNPNCIPPSLQEKLRRSICENNFVLNAPNPPNIPDGCDYN